MNLPFSTEIPEKIYTIPGYEAYFCARDNDRGGGIAVYISNSIIAIEKEKLNLLDTSFIVLDLPVSQSRIIGIYRTQKCPDDIFFATVENLLIKYPKSLILGDININILNSKASNTIWMKSVVSACGYVFLNNLNAKYYTRFSTTPSALDHVITDMIKSEFCVSLFDTPEFDHRIILVDKSDKLVNDKRRNQQFRIIDYEKIFSNLPSTFNNTSTNFKDIIDSLSQLISCNTKVIRKRHPDTWITAEFLSIIKIRDLFYSLQIKYPSNAYYKKRFKHFRNQANYCKRKLMLVYNNNKLQQSVGSSKAIWSILKKMIFNKDDNGNANPIIALLNEKSQIVHDSFELSKIFNYYFVNITSLSEVSARTQQNPVLHFSTYLKYDRLPSLEFSTTNNLEISTIIKGLNSKAASGYDAISVKFIEKFKYFLVPIVVELVNDCIAIGHFPDCLKIAKVHPVYKSGNKLLPSNYRPISVLNVFSKIFEKIIVDRIRKYFLANIIINPYQFGFVENSSTQCAAVTVLNEILLGLDNKQYVSMLSIDLRKAFDTVPHDILLSKLKKLNPCKQTYSLLSSYFSNRTQYTVVNGIDSDPLEILSGVPQGSIFGPIAFNFFINDMFNLELSGKLIMYADDSVLIYKTENPYNLIDQMTIDILRIENWLLANRMSMNMDKTNYIIFQNKRFPSYFPSHLEVNGNQIHQVQSTTYLGLVIDQNLNWGEHILKIKQTIWPYVFAIKRIRKYIDEKTAWMIYNAYINSRINYLSPLWTTASNSNLKGLKILQNRFIKMIKRLPVLTSTKSIYSPNILPIGVLGNYQLLIFIRKCQLGITKCNITFTTVSKTHTYNTRWNTNTKFYISTVSTTRAQNNPFYKGLVLFNELPESLKSVTNIQKYKQLLRTHLFTRWLES